MRYHEIASGLRLPVSGEEQELLNKAPFEIDDLDERDAEVARLMVGRGVLHQTRKDDGGIIYKDSSAKDIWRGRDG
jgi:hypothetical protein